MYIISNGTPGIETNILSSCSIHIPGAVPFKFSKVTQLSSTSACLILISSNGALYFKKIRFTFGKFSL
jgi:hypothetical protein